MTREKHHIMSTSSSVSRAVTITGVIAALSVSAYALYFDHKRRSNPEFRKQLKQRSKQQKKDISLAKEQEQKAKLQKVTEFLTKELVENPIPNDPSQREAIFASNVEQGERLAMTANNELAAAAKFYKALTVYPNPADLLGIYQRSIPEGIYEYIVLMIAILPPANVSTFLNSGPSKQEAEVLADANTIDE